MTVKCPICKQPVAPENPEFPFCRERCRILDLGAWASGEYVFPGPPIAGLPDDGNED